MKPFWKGLIILSPIALATIIILYRKEIMNKVWDIITGKRIDTLHPLIRDRVRQFINEAEKQGIKLRVTSANRTFDEQNNLYAQGRTTTGTIVTNAKGGESYHNYSLAVDVVQMINGVPNWNGDWKKIGNIGKSFGLTWGGDFKSIVDKPHFQYDNGGLVTIPYLQNKYANSDFYKGYINIA